MNEFTLHAKRENWIDWSKSLLIFLVVLDHTGLVNQWADN